MNLHGTTWRYVNGYFSGTCTKVAQNGVADRTRTDGLLGHNPCFGAENTIFDTFMALLKYTWRYMEFQGRVAQKLHKSCTKFLHKKAGIETSRQFFL
jgi:hypothetical protein